MTTTILAHFDGLVLVPEEPIDIPVGTPLRVSYEPLEPTLGATSGAHALPPVEPAGPSIVDQLPLVRGLGSKLVREIIDDPENELCNVGAEEFLRGVTAKSDPAKAG